jgi:hypothetical protein
VEVVRAVRIVVESVVRSLRRKPSAAVIVSMVALVLSVAGNAAASLVITSNSQVAEHTIEGAAASSGNHNLISGSVGTSDLHSASVSTDKLTSQARAHRIDWTESSVGANAITLLTLDELTLKATCYVMTSPGQVSLTVDTESTVAASGSYFAGKVAGGKTTPEVVGIRTPAGSGLQIVNLSSGHTVSGGFPDRENGQFTYRNASRVITVSFDALAWNGKTAPHHHTCEVFGTAYEATAG